jgi:hypothetical protein
MPAPKGNKFWLMRASSGRKKIFKNPKALWKAACEYFEWVDENPLEEEKLFAYQGTITRSKISKIRAMTIDGLCLFLGVTRTTWDNYRANEDFVEITGQIENVIKGQKFAGAAADLLNANIIARDLGLKDGQDITSAGKPIKNEWHIHPVATIPDGKD